MEARAGAFLHRSRHVRAYGVAHEELDVRQPDLAADVPHAAPKDIFQAACDELDRYFARDGLRYVRSRPRLEHKRGELTLAMAMWSSRSNMPGEAVALEVVSTVHSTELKKWIKKTGVGRNDAVFSVATNDPETGHYRKYFDAWGINSAKFIELAEEIRTWCWAPMSSLGPNGEVPDPLPPRLEMIEDNYACWLWMRGEHERALGLPGLASRARGRTKETRVIVQAIAERPAYGAHWSRARSLDR